MRSDRLLKLADFLEIYVKPEWFNLGRWFTPGFPERQCNSTACALGWASQIPEFAKAGLRLEESDGHCMVVYDDINNDECIDEGAAVSFFDIPSDVAEWLFVSRFNRNHLDVARDIRELVANGGAIPNED